MVGTLRAWKLRTVDELVNAARAALVSVFHIGGWESEGGGEEKDSSEVEAFVDSLSLVAAIRESRDAMSRKSSVAGYLWYSNFWVSRVDGVREALDILGELLEPESCWLSAAERLRTCLGPIEVEVETTWGVIWRVGVCGNTLDRREEGVNVWGTVEDEDDDDAAPELGFRGGLFERVVVVVQCNASEGVLGWSGCTSASMRDETDDGGYLKTGNNYQERRVRQRGDCVGRQCKFKGLEKTQQNMSHSRYQSTYAPQPLKLQVCDQLRLPETV
jgi:hypothetical protein